MLGIQFLDSLTRQKLDYLAENNLGPVHFTQDDFAAWASGGNDRIEEELHERIKDLGEALAKALGKHKMVSQKRIQDYIGINILADEFAHESVEQVPHWSLALTSPKGLTLYIQCESKPLVGTLAKEEGTSLKRTSSRKNCVRMDSDAVGSHAQCDSKEALHSFLEEKSRILQCIEVTRHLTWRKCRADK